MPEGFDSESAAGMLRRQQSLSAVIESISSELELRPLLTPIVRHACELLDADNGTIGLVDAERRVVRTEALTPAATFVTLYAGECRNLQVRGSEKRSRQMATDAVTQRQVNIRVDSALYHVLEKIAHQERQSVPQAARSLLEEGLQRRIGGSAGGDDAPGSEVAALAAAGGAFDWLAEEPDLYDDTCGEPV